MRTIVLLSHTYEVQDWLISFFKTKHVRNIAYVMDAKKPRLIIEPGHVFKDKLAFEAAGFNVKFVELEAAKSENLEGTFKDIDAIYVKGGNAFYLLNAMRVSGFDKLVNKLLDKGVVYVGESAGAYAACPTIEMAHWKHQDRDIVGLEDLTGLNLVPFLVSAHYTDELSDTLAPYIDECEYDVKLLRDGEAIVSEDGKIESIRIG